MEEAATERSCRFRLPKSCKEEVSLLRRSKPKSIQCKDKWAVDVFRNWEAALEKKIPLLQSGSVFKDYDVHRVQSLEERLKVLVLDSLPLNFWLIKFVQELSNNTGGRYPPRSLYEIVCGLKPHLEDENLEVNERLSSTAFFWRLISKHTCLNVLTRVFGSVLYPVSRGIHVTQMRPHLIHY